MAVESKERNRRGVKGSVGRCHNKVVKTMTDGLRSSDKILTELEEKRLKFEEKQREKKREFQLKMIQML